MATEKTIVFITGGNTGLGLAVVKALTASAHPYEIVIGSRSLSKGENAITAVMKELSNTTSSLSTVQADLTSDSSLEQAVQSIGNKFGRLDVLINNGGAHFDMLYLQGQLTMREAWNAAWDTNVVGTHVLTCMAAPLLLKSSNPRLIFLASGSGSVGETEDLDSPVHRRLNDSPEKGWPKENDTGPQILAYRSAKTGLNMVMRDWHRALLNDGVMVWAISPGMLATNLGGIGPDVLRKLGALEPEVGARLIQGVIEGERDRDVGKVVKADGVQPW